MAYFPQKKTGAPNAHASTHENAGTDEINVDGLSGLLGDPQKIIVRKDSGADIGSRIRLNFIAGPNITLTIDDDDDDNEIDITISSTGGEGSIDGIVGASYTNGVDELNLTGRTKVLSIVKFAGNFTRVVVVGEGGPGDATIGVKACSHADYLTDPSNLADITDGNDIVLSSVHGLDDSTLADWTVAIGQYDVVELELKAVSGFTFLGIALVYA